jgi:hypothetical protein
MTPDRTKVPPMQMLLLRFHGASYISTLDLSSAFFADTTGKKPQGNGQLFSSRTRCTNLHAYHVVAEILCVLIRAFQSVLAADASESLIMLITAHENMKGK